MIGAKQRIVRAFDEAVDYDAHADVQQRTAAALAARLADLPLPPSPRVLEFGCGTGFLAAAAKEAVRAADWLMTDISPAMVERSRVRFCGSSRHRFAVLDAEHPDPSLAPGRFDLVCSSLAAQWFEDLDASVAGLMDLVKPGGTLIFTVLAGGSFHEWEAAHRSHGLRSGLRRLPSLAQLAALRPLGVQGEIDCKHVVRVHPDGRTFLRSLREIGASTPKPGHRPLTPAVLRAVMRQFEQRGGTATYVVATCLFRRPAEGGCE